MKTKMEEEIFSQSSVISAIEEKYINFDKINFDFEVEFEEIKFIASGSSYNAARLGYKFFEKYTDKRISFEYASEFISNNNKKIKNDTLYCFVSQSGETFDTKCALEIVKKDGGKTLAVVNNSNSTIFNASDYKIDMCAGAEFSIAATKSFLSGVVCLWLFALKYSKQKIDVRAILKEAQNAINDTLSDVSSVQKNAKIIAKKKKISIIGYGFGYILAKEGALKIKETSFIDTSAYPTGEFLHGHTAILNKSKTLVEIFTSNLSEFEKNTLKKIEADFHPKIVAITDVQSKIKNAVKFKKYNSDLAKICAITCCLQLLALYTAIFSGADVDRPHGLNKVVSG